MKQSKLTKDKYVVTLVDAALHQRISEAATKEKRSISQFVRLLIERNLEKKAV